MKIFRRSKLSLSFLISGSVVALFVLTAIFAPWLANDPENVSFAFIPFGPETIDIINSDFLAAPNSIHWFGTDYIGRDILSRIIHGVKNSLFFSFAVVIICAIIGSMIGGIMGFFGGKVDLILSRFMEVIGNFPIFLLQLTLLAFLSQGYGVLLFVMCLAGWIPYCRFIRAEFFKLKNQDFVQAAEVIGASKKRIFFRHLLPNSMTPIITYIPFDLTSTIISLGALSFLGFGEPINAASLGGMLKQAQGHLLTAPWFALFPSLCLFFMTLSFAIFGSEIREKLDPRS